VAQSNAQPSTGLVTLDRVIKGLIPGDNIVWQVDSIDDYLPFVKPYCDYAFGNDQRLIYFRFAKHRSLVDGNIEAEVHKLDPAAGFEQFLAGIHRVIRDVGRGGYYLFDCLSDLVVDWYSDRMLGNFFILTCPYLYDMKAIAYFPLLRNYHSFHATSAIAETTQVLLDVRRHKGTLYVQPLKVLQRYSPTMYMLHEWNGDDFAPITQSTTNTEILQSAPWGGIESRSNRLDVWNRTFLQAEDLLEAIQRGEAQAEKADEYFRRLLRMAVSRHERMFGLAAKYLTLADLLDIGRRTIGTGLIGGKSVGMLLARAILEQSDPRWGEVLEPHDSFFVGSDVFYTFLVTNGIWSVRQQQRDSETFMSGAEAARHRILVGRFPDYIERQFADMLDYFGQCPIIVRSSSLLEDDFGNAFAGKYESVFCVNQGPRHKRLEDFLSAVRTIYASAMSEEALTYRAQRGMLEHDEQMALLIQRVSGAIHDRFFYPQVAGVGLSFNPYVWSKYIDPKAGVIRLVFALGTRAVERHDDDYTRVVALNAPEKKIDSNYDETIQYSQKKVDVLDLEANHLLSKSFSEVVRQSPDLPIEMFASRSKPARDAARRSAPKDVSHYVLTFEGLLGSTHFVEDMREMLKTLQTAYDYPVDVEFTANLVDDSRCKINLLQCRPFQYKGGGTAPKIPERIPKECLVLEAQGAVIGQSREVDVDRLIYVVPSEYGRLTVADRYSVARLIGEITHLEKAESPATVMLLGPGRWGTTTPFLGVPIHFSEINTVSILCEIVAMREGLIPDVSLGTHLFSEMVEMDILYLALFPSKEDNFLNCEFFEKAPNRLTELLPRAAKWAHIVRVIDIADLKSGHIMKLNANALEQRVVCYLDNDK